jgi:aromatic-L-amino-acid/L-tryptophan decarboxylase
MPMKTGDMDLDDFRRQGHRLIDWVADYLGNPEAYPVLSKANPGDIRSRLPASPPEEPESMDEIIRDLENIVVPGLTHWNHLGFMAYFGITASCPGILGELLCAAFNVNAMLWKTSPSATELEEQVLDWLRQMLGLPAAFQGVIYDTASISSFHAVAAAREAVPGLKAREQGLSGRPEVPRLRLYASEQAHSSIEKAAIAAGIGQAGIRKIGVDDCYRLDPRELAAAIRQDRDAGIRPFCVVATVGTTSTTSVDPLPAVADICGREGLWLHVDAAYGGSAALLPEMRWVFEGCERADSVVVNPHKWLFTPIDISTFFCRRMDVLRQAFSLVPEYLKTEEDQRVRNYMDYGVQLGRRFRALKLWMVIRTFGRSGLIDRIREHIQLARWLAEEVEAHPDFEILAPVPFSTLCFRFRPAKQDLAPAEIDRLNEAVLNGVNASGQVFLSHTRLRGNFALRVAIGNIRTEKRHVETAWRLIRDEASRLRPA